MSDFISGAITEAMRHDRSVCTTSWESERCQLLSFFFPTFEVSEVRMKRQNYRSCVFFQSH
jgi:hypothetical protein